MFMAWLKNRRRRKLLSTPYPPSWLDYLDVNLAQYRSLSIEEQSKLRDDLRVFIAEKNWEGCGGLKLTDEMKVTIAAYACLMTLGLSGRALGRESHRSWFIPRPTRVPDVALARRLVDHGRGRATRASRGIADP